ncbi:transposase [Paenibacillus paeoniae]|uniref:Transposase n=1 Tax=Paenibacillus paeoniae TaxID=2292705 RepID=A0A371PNB3_9BACL|nr:transposase [Paenibacillus paeoniae]REK77671.1 transposase [Paenibacillus paeoniae]
MIETFMKALYESIVEENLELYKNIYETTKVTPKTDVYWKQAIDMYNSLSDENKKILMRIIKQTMIDTISNTLGVIDGSSTLKDCLAEPKCYLNSIETDGELQEYFLAFIEENEDYPIHFKI